MTQQTQNARRCNVPVHGGFVCGDVPENVVSSVSREHHRCLAQDAGEVSAWDNVRVSGAFCILSVESFNANLIVVCQNLHDGRDTHRSTPSVGTKLKVSKVFAVCERLQNSHHSHETI